MTSDVQCSILKVQATHLGLGFAGNTVNTVPFRNFGCSFEDQYNFVASFFSGEVLRLFKRRYGGGLVECFDLKGNFPICDAHNAVSLGIDTGGYLHLAYSDHGGTLHYRVSLEPLAIDRWSVEIQMTGIQEDRLTYPQFYTGSSARTGLFFIYRYGSWKKARVGIKSFDALSRVWRDIQVALVAGDLDSPWSSCPYINTPAFGLNNDIHLAYTWRSLDEYEPDAVVNLDLCYTKSVDGGETWSVASGKRLPVPITRNISDTIFISGRGRDLLNQCGSCVAIDGSYHICTIMKDDSGVARYWYIANINGAWVSRPISEIPSSYMLRGGGTLCLPTSRPEIVVYPTGEVYIFYRNNFTEGRIVAHQVATNFGAISVDRVQVIGTKNIVAAEVCIDKTSLNSKGIIGIWEQENFYAPDSELNNFSATNIDILDVAIE